MKISEAYENVTGEVRNVTWRNVTIIDPRYAAMYINVFQVRARLQPRMPVLSAIACAAARAAGGCGALSFDVPV